ncbi:hypothetical protein ABI59_20155 [Acidobacteria bacterium Mor1]|nr:hypothetical protein ABI59_20155 [Acidobacteria bacterium Mor1]
MWITPLVSLVVALGLSVSVSAAQQPETLDDLLAAFGHTFSQILTPDEFRQYRTRNADEIRRADPELYQKISQNVVRWTDAWVKHVEADYETIPEERVAQARSEAAEVDEKLRGYFAERQWDYKRMRVVFLAQRRLYGPGGAKSRGVFLRYYPDAFFSTVDHRAPRQHVLVHESLHYNAAWGFWGPVLVEAVTEAKARRISAEFGWPIKQNREEYYPLARKRLDPILEQISARRSCTGDEALDLLFEDYLKGDDAHMTETFGVEAWSKIVDMSRAGRRWNKKDILKVLEGAPKPE